MGTNQFYTKYVHNFFDFLYKLDFLLQVSYMFLIEMMRFCVQANSKLLAYDVFEIIICYLMLFSNKLGYYQNRLWLRWSL